jgi:hypothetical protein
VYAAKGFVVVNTAFPWPDEGRSAAMGASSMSTLYSPQLDFPQLTMLMESTLRGLDTVAARGFVDDKRIGIGGVSHGTFVPLYMLQKYDRIAAISISSTTWGPHEYYWTTPKAREVARQTFGQDSDGQWPPNPDAGGATLWPQIDIADHVDAIEAPILMNLADQEMYGLVRLLRKLSDAGKPYDAYVFRNENHSKWQPAHLRAILERNLDWFSFWLQSYEDSSTAKVEQYAGWRKLRSR